MVGRADALKKRSGSLSGIARRVSDPYLYPALCHAQWSYSKNECCSRLSYVLYSIFLFWRG